jgi:chromosome partitioning protein
MKTLVIAMVGRKGGSGKTTTTFNLAGALAARGQRVLLVDTDPQGSLTRILLGDTASEGLGARLIAPARGVADLIVPLAESGMALLPGDTTMREARAQLSGNPAASVRLRVLLNSLAGFDAIIIDTPPELDFPAASAVLAAHLCLLPTDLSQQSLDALEDSVQFVEEQLPLGGGRLVGIVPTDVRARERFDRDALVAIQTGYGALVRDPVAYSPRIKESMATRVPLVSYDPKTPAAEAYRSLAAFIVDAARQSPGGGS